METRQKDYEIVGLQYEKDQLPKEVLERSRNGSHGVDEVGASEENNEERAVAGQNIGQIRRRLAAHRDLESIGMVPIFTGPHDDGENYFWRPERRDLESNGRRLENYVWRKQCRDLESHGGIHEVIVGEEDNEEAAAGQDVELLPRDNSWGHLESHGRRLENYFWRAQRRGLEAYSRHARLRHLKRALRDLESQPTDEETFLRALRRALGGDFEPHLENRGAGDSAAHEDGSNGCREERQRDLESEEEEERKSALKFSYFSTSIASAGIIGIFVGFTGDHTRLAHSVHLNICYSFLVATFASGASMILLERLLRIGVSIHIIRYLKYASFGFLALSIFNAFIIFLKS